MTTNCAPIDLPFVCHVLSSVILFAAGAKDWFIAKLKVNDLESVDGSYVNGTTFEDQVGGEKRGSSEI